MYLSSLPQNKIQSVPSASSASPSSLMDNDRLPAVSTDVVLALCNLYGTASFLSTGHEGNDIRDCATEVIDFQSSRVCTKYSRPPDPPI